MTWLAQAEGADPSAHETEEDAIAAIAGKRYATCWEVNDEETAP